MMCGLRRMVVVAGVAGLLAVVAWGVMGAARGDSKKETGEEAGWSAEVNGMRARITLERGEVLNGTTLISVRISLKNVQDVGNALKVPWSRADLKFRVEDGEGKELRVGLVFYDGFVFDKLDLVLPYKGELSFDITSRGAGVPGDQLAQIDLGPDSTWMIPRDGKEYFLKGTLKIGQVGHDPPWFGWYGKIELPAARIPSKPEPADTATNEKLIAELGPKILVKDSRTAEEALRKLSMVDDKRVIPWYVKAMATDNYELKSAALDRLSRFEGDEALAGLKVGMGTQGKDIGNCTTEAVADQMAENIRVAAAGALARSPHPEAKKLLLTMAGDSYDGVRLTVIQAAARMEGAEAQAVLEAATKDKDERVRGEAVRLLELRMKEGK